MKERPAASKGYCSLDMNGKAEGVAVAGNRKLKGEPDIG